MKKEYILCAAVKRIEPRTGHDPYHVGQNDLMDIEIGYRHHDIYMRFEGEVSKKMTDQGFYTSRGRFVNRTDAMKIAYEAGQVDKETAFDYRGEFEMLFSEDLY